MNIKEDFYRILSIPRMATANEVKKAYHKLAKQYHPDKHPANPTEANKLFHKVKSAYITLSDPNKREFYDLFTSLDKRSTESSYNEIFSNIYSVMKNIQAESKDSDEQLEGLVLSCKRLRKDCKRPAAVREESSDEEKLLNWSTLLLS